MKVAKRKLTSTEACNYKAENEVKHPIGSQVFWDEDKFSDDQMVRLIQKFGMQPLTIISENEFEEFMGCKWAVWVWFEYGNGYREKTRPSNLKPLTS